MTQAISMRDILTKNGHEVVEVLVGKSERREIPKFFFDKIHAPVHTYESPNFLVTSNNKGILLFQSIIFNLKRSGRYFKSMAFINKKIKETKPDLVINFYELLAGFTYAVYNPSTPYICLGHQFLLLHPDFVFPNGQLLQRWMLNFNTRLTSIRAKKFLALSFSPMKDLPEKKLFVVPPLLRKEVLELTPGDDGYILGYMLNAGYSEEIISWHQKQPQVIAHFFWDKKEAPEDIEVEPNLFFHRINDVKFLSYMKNCSGYASTSGFESICEAMYLRKPILMVPTKGHFEQESNSVDASRAGAGIVSDRFELDKLLTYIPQYNSKDTRFVGWAQKAELRFLELLTV
jgi:uncharacterized protein (TIGR00661 family)